MKFQEIIHAQASKIQLQESQILAYQSENETLKKRCEQYFQAYEQMEHQLKELIRNRFGKKSERFIDPENIQLSIFKEENSNLFSIADAAGAALTEEEINMSYGKRSQNH